MGLFVHVVLLATLARTGFGSFRVVTADDMAPTEIDHQLALFGRPKFGSGLVAPLVLPPQADRQGCQPLDLIGLHTILASYGIETTQTADGIEHEPFVLLVQRGNCHFVEKARHAQAAGAAAVLVYDTGDDNAKLPVLADDGSGGDIQIPSLLIHHKDAQRLITQLENHTKTIVTIHWDVPHPDDHVEFSLWFSSRSSPQLHAFIENFQTVVHALGESVLFTPHYDVHLGSAWGCSREHGDARPMHCPDLCAFSERFCTYDPEKNNTIGLDGKDVIEEDVRQLCIYEHAQATTNTSALFWEYLARFNARCSVPEATSQQFNKVCSKAVQRELGIPDSIMMCAENEESAVKRLQDEIDALRDFHAVNFPELTVNGIPMFGSVTCDKPISLATCTPLNMICAGFAERYTPAACHETYWKTESECVAPLERDDCDVCSLRGSQLWNAQCVGCDGIPHSGKRVDSCGVCGGDGSFDVCGLCLSANDNNRDKTCLDCKGVPHGSTQRDACGVCGGHGSFDACGLCLNAKDPRRQNFACHVLEDPDAVVAKVEIRGFNMKQFHGDVVASFQEAVAFLSGMRPDQILVKSVDDTNSDGPTTVVLFFVACDTDTCRNVVSKKLHDPSSAHAIAMKMKSSLDTYAYGLELSKLIEHVTLHAVNAVDHIAQSAQFAGPGSEEHESWLGVIVACGLTLTAGLLLMRIRDDRMRREFRELFARYTPLTAMDYEDEQHDGARHPSGDADAW